MTKVYFSIILADYSRDLKKNDAGKCLKDNFEAERRACFEVEVGSDFGLCGHSLKGRISQFLCVLGWCFGSAKIFKSKTYFRGCFYL